MNHLDNVRASLCENKAGDYPDFFRGGWPEKLGRHVPSRKQPLRLLSGDYPELSACLKAALHSHLQTIWSQPITSVCVSVDYGRKLEDLENPHRHRKTLAEPETSSQWIILQIQQLITFEEVRAFQYHCLFKLLTHAFIHLCLFLYKGGTVRKPHLSRAGGQLSGVRGPAGGSLHQGASHKHWSSV